MGATGNLGNTVHNEEAIWGISKIERKDNSGTTVVFYSFPDEQEAKKIKDGEEWRLSSLNETTTEFHAYDVSPANDAVKKDFKESFRQIEGIADIKYYDINNLSDADKAHFADTGVKVPATPDFIVYRVGSELVDFNGQAGFPRKTDTDEPAHVKIEYNRSEDPMQATGLLSTVLHESLHTLGFMHPFRQEGDGGKPVLDKLSDNRGNTVMSYNAYDNYATPFEPQKYQRFDVAALQEAYGISKHPTLNLWPDIVKDEKARAALATTDLPTYLKAQELKETALDKLQGFNDTNFQLIQDATKNAVFDKKGLDALLHAAPAAKKQLTPEELAFLDKRNPNLGEVTITPLSEASPNTQVAIHIETDKTQFKDKIFFVDMTPDARKELDKKFPDKANGSYHLDLLNKSDHTLDPISIEPPSPQKSPEIPAKTPPHAENIFPRPAWTEGTAMADVPTKDVFSVTPLATVSPPAKTDPVKTPG